MQLPQKHTMDWSKSNGSKPEATTGGPSSSQIHSYGSTDSPVETCPGPMNPSRRISGGLENGADRWDIVTVIAEDGKIMDVLGFVLMSVSAVEGAVVSNPIARNITLSQDIFFASSNASAGEYTMRTSVPGPLCSKGQRAPRHAHHVTKGREDDVRIFRNGQPIVDSSHRQNANGQPGPWISSIFEGRISLRPKRYMACVWPATYFHNAVVPCGVGQTAYSLQKPS